MVHVLVSRCVWLLGGMCFVLLFLCCLGGVVSIVIFCYDDRVVVAL